MDRVSWKIYKHPTRANEFTREKETPFVPLSDKLKNTIVLPGRNFTIVYPAARNTDREIREYYDAGGEPLTVNDLLYTLYTFYQQPVTKDEIKKWEYPKDAKTLADGMEGLHFFEGLVEISPDVYGLELGS